MNSEWEIQAQYFTSCWLEVVASRACTLWVEQVWCHLSKRRHTHWNTTTYHTRTQTEYILHADTVRLPRLPSPKTQHLISRRNSQVMHSGDHTVHTKCSQEWTQLILLSVALHLTPTSPDFPNHNNNLAFIQRLWVRLRVCTPYLCSTWCCSWICCHFSQEWKPEGRSRETSHPFKLIIMSLRPRPSHPAYWPIVFVFVF